MAEELKKNSLVGDKTGLSIYDLEQELKGIFTRTFGLEAAERLIDELDTQWRKELTKANFLTKEDGTIDAEKWNAWAKEQKRKTDPVAELVVIDERGFWRGMVFDTPENRAKLEAKGYDVSSGMASKQYVKCRRRWKAQEKRSE